MKAMGGTLYGEVVECEHPVVDVCTGCSLVIRNAVIISNGDQEFKYGD